MSTSTAIQRRDPGGMSPLVERFNSEAFRSRVAAIVPKHIDPNRLIRMALMAISGNRALRECTPDSLMLETCNAAAMGLMFGASLGQAYLVPFKGVATLIIGYRGLMALARKSGEISNIAAEVVRKGDKFTYSFGRDPDLSHTFGDSVEDADITHVWASAKLRDGGFQFVVLRRSEVDKIRRRSRASDNGPWVTDYAEMAKKTALRRLCKMLPLTPDAEQAIANADTSEFGDMVIDEADHVTTIDRIDAALGIPPGVNPQTGELIPGATKPPKAEPNAG